MFSHDISFKLVFSCHSKRYLWLQVLIKVDGDLWWVPKITGLLHKVTHKNSMTFNFLSSLKKILNEHWGINFLITSLPSLSFIITFKADEGISGTKNTAYRNACHIYISRKYARAFKNPVSFSKIHYKARPFQKPLINYKNTKKERF